MERPIQEWREYPRAWGELWYRLYGYSIVRAEYHAGAIYTLWEHGREPGDFPIEQHVAPYPGVVLAEPVA
jgi:hypothetical protein